jgi:hypothetical protein
VGINANLRVEGVFALATAPLSLGRLTTPAMSAGKADRGWSSDELPALLD